MLKLIVSPDSVSSRSAARFRQGPHGMGWTVCRLAKTLLVSEETVVQWEAAEQPIPPKVLEWVEMYARSDAADTEEVVDAAARY